MSEKDAKQQQISLFQLLALPANWLIPGLGLLLIGEKKRAIIIMIAIHLTMLVGLLIGGVSAVDSKRQFLYYVFQVPAGPGVLAVDAVHLNMRQDVADDVKNGLSLGDEVVYHEAFGNELTIGALYLSIAGLMNLFVFYDLVFRILAPQNRALRHEVFKEEDVPADSKGEEAHVS